MAKNRTNKHKTRSAAKKSDETAAEPDDVAAAAATIAQNSLSNFSKKDVDKRKKDLEDELKKFIKIDAWRNYKFVNSTPLEHRLCLRYLDYANWDGFSPKTKKGVEARKEWLATNGGEMLKALNAVRNDVNIALKKVFKKWQQDELFRSEEAKNDANATEDDKEAMDLPTAEELQRCLDRSLDLKVPVHQAIAMWYVDEVLPKAGGAPNTIWCEASRRYETISNSGPGEDGDKIRWITPSTEAYAVAMLENFRNYSIALFKWGQANPGKKASCQIKKDKSAAICDEMQAKATKKNRNTIIVWTDDADTKATYGSFDTLWSRSDAGQQKNGGWDPAAIARLAELQAINKKIRGSKKSERWEKQVLELIRHHHGITSKSKDEEGKKKRRKTVEILDEDDENFVELDVED
jgi:hypothetical protein